MFVRQELVVLSVFGFTGKVSSVQMKPGGRLVLFAMSDRNAEEGWIGPRRISEADIRHSLRECAFSCHLSWPAQAATIPVCCAWIPDNAALYYPACCMNSVICILSSIPCRRN